MCAHAHIMYEFLLLFFFLLPLHRVGGACVCERSRHVLADIGQRVRVLVSCVGLHALFLNACFGCVVFGVRVSYSRLAILLWCLSVFSSSCSNTPMLITQLFSQFSIVVRILKNVQENEGNRKKDEARREQDTQKLLDALAGSGMAPRKVGEGLPPSSSHKSLSAIRDMPEDQDAFEDQDVSSSIPVILASSPSAVEIPALPPSEVIPALRTLQHMQNSLDAARDLEDLRSSMRAAMQTGSDLAVVEMMQVPREEMPEAMKTLQRALERVVERQECVEENGQQQEEAPLELSESGGDWGTRDTLDREFIETGIEALRRLSEGLETMPLPSWTITR